jgi:hypothetical protein
MGDNLQKNAPNAWSYRPNGEILPNLVTLSVVPEPSPYYLGHKNIAPYHSSRLAYF